MIYLQLFFSFLKIGTFSFGGGSGMFSLIRETVLAHEWMSEAELLSFIAIAESTPGPIAVNIATFIGSSQGGFLGALLATLGVVLPSFLIILIIAALIREFMKYKIVDAVIGGIRPTVVGLALATAVTIALSTLFAFTSVGNGFKIDMRAIAILAILVAVHFISKRVTKHKPSPILMILLSASLGVLFYIF